MVTMIEQNDTTQPAVVPSHHHHQKQCRNRIRNNTHKMQSLTMSDGSQDNITPCAEESESEKGVHSRQPTNLAFQLRNLMAQKS